MSNLQMPAERLPVMTENDLLTFFAVVDGELLSRRQPQGVGYARVVKLRVEQDEVKRRLAQTGFHRKIRTKVNGLFTHLHGKRSALDWNPDSLARQT